MREARHYAVERYRMQVSWGWWRYWRAVYGALCEPRARRPRRGTLLAWEVTCRRCQRALGRWRDPDVAPRWGGDET
jgi:hypothetical protein